MAVPSPTPKSLGYRWPAEWEPHAATWVAWPHRRESWPGNFEAARMQFAHMARTIAEYEPVHILAGSDVVMAEALGLIAGQPNMTLHPIRTNDAWCRDHGPTFLVGPRGSPPALVDWEYNAWGGKYPPFDADNAVPAQIAALQNRHRFTPGIILEGGAIEGNGRGTVLTTEQCLLNPNRNPHLSRTDIEQYLADYLDSPKVLWLSGGELAGDDTDGHVDQLARFVNPTTIVIADETNPKDANYAPLQKNTEQLRDMTDQNGNPLSVVKIPMPKPKYFRSQRLPASYMNFYIANGIVLVPQFQDRADKFAVEILSSLFPDRQVRGLPALDLVLGLGAFHCLTQQEPVCE